MTGKTRAKSILLCVFVMFLTGLAWSVLSFVVGSANTNETLASVLDSVFFIGSLSTLAFLIIRRSVDNYTEVIVAIAVYFAIAFGYEYLSVQIFPNFARLFPVPASHVWLPISIGAVVSYSLTTLAQRKK